MALGATPSGDTTVTIEDETIVAVGAEPAGSDTIIDLDERTLLPSLINAHSHLGGVAMLQEDAVPAGVIAAWIFEHCRRALDLGITTRRETACLDGGVVAAIDQGLAPGPRIIPCGPTIVQMGGHADFRPAWVSDPCPHHQGIPGLAVLTSFHRFPIERLTVV